MVEKIAAKPQAKEGVEVTYMPGLGDPVTTTWRGLRFHAGEPKLVHNDEHVEAAKANRFFRVKGHAKDTGDNPNRPPKNEMEYRAHVVRWLQNVTGIEELIQRFAGERDLRRDCGVGEEDLRWLGTLVEPKITQLRAEHPTGMDDKAVVDMWARYGFSEIPWRG